MQTIYLDISNNSVLPTIYAKQGDVGRKFKALITDGGLKYPLSTKTFSAGYEGASGSGNYEEIYGESAFEITGNTVVVELAPNMFQVPGDSVFCLTMKDGNSSVIGLWNIPVYTEKTPGFLSDPIGDYYPSLSAVLYKEQELTPEQQEQARYNIGAADVSTVLDLDRTILKRYGELIISDKTIFYPCSFYEDINDVVLLDSGMFSFEQVTDLIELEQGASYQLEWTPTENYEKAPKVIYYDSDGSHLATQNFNLSTHSAIIKQIGNRKYIRFYYEVGNIDEVQLYRKETLNPDLEIPQLKNYEFFALDKTLTREGAAADAKAVGDKLGDIETALDAIIAMQNDLIGGDGV